MLNEIKLENEIKNILIYEKNFLKFTTSQIFDKIKGKLKFEESDINQITIHIYNICKKLESESFLKIIFNDVKKDYLITSSDYVKRDVDKLTYEIRYVLIYKDYYRLTISQIFDEIKDKLNFEVLDINNVMNYIYIICDKLASESFLELTKYGKDEEYSVELSDKVKSTVYSIRFLNNKFDEFKEKVSKNKIQ